MADYLRVAHPLGHPGLNRQPRGVHAGLHDFQRVLGREEFTVAAAVIDFYNRGMVVQGSW